MILAAVITLLILLAIICGLKWQLDKCAGLLARANELNQRLAIESIRQAISSKL